MNLVCILLGVALAGPTWGEEASVGVAVGRDLVIVIDISRSMWAEDMKDREAPERWQTAVAGAKDLVSAARRRGGDRIALVNFAARPHLLSPLTTDYDHLDLKLDVIDARHPPAEVRPDRDDAPSGTRIGTALSAAVAQHDERFPGFQDIVLFTDADDPVGGREWSAGVSAARAAGIPVHVVGLGDPALDALLLQNGEPLEMIGQEGLRSPILTRLNESDAQAIAAEGRGIYVPARTNPPSLGEFYRNVIADNSRREISDERRLQPRNWSHVFYAAAVMMLTLAWCWPVRSDKVKI